MTVSPMAYPKIYLAVVVAILSVVAVGTLVEGHKQSFVTCKINCGETFDALAHIEDFRANGLKYGLIEVIASSDDPDVRPVLYTHNVNLGGIVFAILDAIGITSITGKQMVTLAAFLAGLFYAYRTTALFTHSQLAGLIVLLLFATDVEHVLSFSLNALRGWHWLALFGVLYYASQLAREPAKPRWSHRLGLLFMAALSFGIGYDFLAIAIAVVGCTFLLLTQRRATFRQYVVLLAWFGFAIVTPVALRQAQIISVLGVHFWSTDLYYSAVIKVNLLSHVLPLPPMEQIEQFYVTERVLRPPATPATSLASILRTARDLIIAVTVPSIGIVTAMLSLCVGTAAIVVAVAVALRGWLGRPVPMPETGAPNAAFRVFGIGSAQLICILLGGSLAGLTLFAPLSLHIYLKHQFPLVAAWIFVTKGIVLTALILLAVRSWRVRSVVSVVSVALVALIVGEHLLIQVESSRVLTRVDMAWTRFVSERPRDAFIVSGTPPSWVEPFLDRQVGFLPAERDIELLGMMRSGMPTEELRRHFVPPVTTEDPLPPTDAVADYWLYAPASFTTSFDMLTADCRADPVLSFVGGLAPRGTATPQLNLFGVWPTVVAPGGTISFVGEFDRPLPPNRSVIVGFEEDVLAANANPTAPSPGLHVLEYNCPRSLVQGHFIVPNDVAPGQRHLLLSVRGPDGLQTANSQIYITIRPGEPPSPIPVLKIPSPVPSIDAMIATGKLKVAERGDGYVIFDLRR